MSSEQPSNQNRSLDHVIILHVRIDEELVQRLTFLAWLWRCAIEEAAWRALVTAVDETVMDNPPLHEAYLRWLKTASPDEPAPVSSG